MYRDAHHPAGATPVSADLQSAHIVKRRVCRRKWIYSRRLHGRLVRKGFRDPLSRPRIRLRLAAAGFLCDQTRSASLVVRCCIVTADELATIAERFVDAWVVTIGGTILLRFHFGRREILVSWKANAISCRLRTKSTLTSVWRQRLWPAQSIMVSHSTATIEGFEEQGERRILQSPSLANCAPSRDANQ